MRRLEYLSIELRSGQPALGEKHRVRDRFLVDRRLAPVSIHRFLHWHWDILWAIRIEQDGMRCSSRYYWLPRCRTET